MTKKFYIATTIPYANGNPHVGFALEIIKADVIARWHKLKNENVFFLTGTDEHGTKNYQTAKKENMTPQEFVNKNSESYQKLATILNISNNNFIRTTDKKNHWAGAIKIWNTLKENNDIYKKKYTGNYCSGCERFIPEKDLINKKCQNHPTVKIETISEENYFFRLSKYSNKIKKLIESDTIEIKPKKWKNGFLALIKNGLTDVSFSRDKKHLPWGIPVPEDNSQIMYVWCDALTNYLTGIGFPNEKYKKFWPTDAHIVGKDMLRFHAGIWIGMLLSAKFELPKKIIVHGFLTVDGKKMSKSTGNIISPLNLMDKYSADTLRYYLMRTIPFGDDGDFSEKHLIKRHNDELANKLGNLISRTTTLAEKIQLEKCENKLAEKFQIEKIKSFLNNFETNKALCEIFTFIDTCNEYIQDKKPWETKDKKVLYEIIDSIKKITILLSPFLPTTCGKIAKHLNFKISLEKLEKPLENLEITKSEILFKKI